MNRIVSCTPDLLSSRHELLQNALRQEEGFEPFYPIENEYPLVLGADALEYSWCFVQGNRVEAHLNLFPRTVLHQGNHLGTMGLIGNVATRPELRGQGLMRELMEWAEKKARQERWLFLTLFSEKTEFYSKFGFTPFGSEHHERLTSRPVSSSERTDIHFELVHPQEITITLCYDLFHLRPEKPVCLRRSSEEFQILLKKIPECHLFVGTQHQQLCCFFILGKGIDLQGVVHEWGDGPWEGQLVREGIHWLMRHLKLESLILLSPGFGSQDVVPVGLGKALSPEGEALLSNLTIWGLDGI